MNGTGSTVQSGQAELAITTWGAEGTPIVALHPGVGDSRIWQWCAHVWAESGHRVVAYDRRGFGATRTIAEDHDDLADLLEVTAATGARPAVFIGNSRGGGLALDLALTHPEHVVALILIAPSPSGYPDGAWQSSPAEVALDDAIERAEASGDLDLVNRLEVRYWLDGVAQLEGRVSGRPRDLMLDMNERALRAEPIGEASPRPAIWPRLGEITAPTLVVAGGFDLPAMTPLCEQLVDAVPNARLTMLAESAHCPSLDRPDELNRVVLEFLATLH